MIQIIETSTINDKKSALNEFNISTDILLVASLNNKIFWRNYFLEKVDLLTDDAVQRASDFWQKLLIYLPQNYSLVSPAFLKTFLTEFISDNELKLQSDTVYRLLLDFQDILYAGDLHEIFDEWLAVNIHKDETWLKHIDDLKIIVGVLEEKKWVTRDLLPALLYKYKDEISKNFNTKDIFITLDFSLSVVETKLFLALSEANHIKVMIPVVKPIVNFKWDYQIYKPLSEDSSLITSSKIFKMLFAPNQGAEMLSVPVDKVVYSEFDTIIAEVVSVVGRIRQLLASGVPSADIAILSTSKERYTLIFDTFMQIEGLHSQSTLDSSLLGVKHLQNLIGRLKLKINKAETEELELSAFHDSKDNTYADFAKNFTNIYQSQSFDTLLDKANITKSDEKKKLTPNNFLDWLLEGVDKIDSAPLTGILNDVPEDVELRHSSWIQYLEQTLGAKFLRKSTIHDGVLQVLDVLESSLQENKHVFILGLNDRDIKEKQNAFIESAIIEKLATDLGFVFPSHFSQRRLLAILQVLQEDNRVYLSYAKNDVSTELLEPSIFHFLLPHDKSTILPSYNLLLQSNRCNDIQTSDSTFASYVMKRLSATQIETYVRCPFIFYAKNVLKLKDVNILDVDVDPMTNGNIIHQALAIIVANKSWPNISQKILAEAINESVLSYQKDIKEEKLIASYKVKAKEYLDAFLQFEVDWRRIYPDTKTIGIEYEINAYLDNNGYFHREPGSNRYPFKAKIDRIDTDGRGNYLVIDYKFKKSSQHTNISTWFSKGSFQLAMYSLLIEDIKEFEDLASVVGGIYYTLKPLERKKGFLLEANTGLYTYNGDKRSFISEDKKQAYYQDLRDKIKQSIAAIEDGKFGPNPLDIKKCDTCAWRNTCRASHLN